MDYTWVITLISIIGVIANIYKKTWCFILWIFSNFTWMVIDYNAGLYAQSFLFLVYFLLAIWGLIQWSREQDERQ